MREPRHDLIDTYALSPVQEGMLFHSLQTREGVYVEQVVGALREPLDSAAFERAWRRVQQRHAQMRVAFRWQDVPRPVQDVHRAAPFPFAFEDWRDAASPQARLQEYLRSDRERGFDLRQAPLMRLGLFRLGDTEHTFVWSFHHALLDGRSFPAVVQEAFAFYQALSRGDDLRLEPPTPYRRHVEWLLAREADPGQREADERFWRRALRGLSSPTAPGLAPPLTRPSAGLEFGEQELRLSPEASAGLERWAREQGLRLSTLVEGAWAVLLAAYSGEQDVVFGVTRAGRRGEIEDADAVVGVFINTLPARVDVDPQASLVPWLKDLRSRSRAVRPHEHTPLVRVQAASDVPPGTPLFECLLVFDTASLDGALKACGAPWASREFRLIERTSYPLTLYAYADPRLWLKIAYDRRRFGDAAVSRVLSQLRTLLEALPASAGARLSQLPLSPPAEGRRLLVEWNDTRLAYDAESTIHAQIETRARLTPDAQAVVCRGESLSYGELNARANRLARRLRALGVGLDARVGIYMERSLELMVALLGVLKAGGAYVPLDPRYPRERVAFMLEDAEVKVLLTAQALAPGLPPHSATLVCLDAETDEPCAYGADDLVGGTDARSLAYVIYTSGSTGRPKGVMVEHRNVLNFFAGMDELLGAGESGVWLAATSLSFDISVLELFWTLARGYTVVMLGDDEQPGASAGRRGGRGTEFSLFYFASDEDRGGGQRYRLLLEGARFADQRGFAAVWTPERHFHAFGGQYPNPAVIGAALAVVTERIQIRAGSVVLPLHHPARVAEEWAVVDNLSGGRVALSFASGWQPNDFVLRPENYAERRDLMYRQIEIVRRLWRGEAVDFPGPQGDPVWVQTRPRPLQPELPVWITSAGSAETYRKAGEAGAYLLTHLLGQSVAELALKIGAYRRGWGEAGHGPGAGHVALMLHTFVGESDDEVRETVREPMTEYLRSSAGLIKDVASSFPVFRNAAAGADLDEAFRRLSAEDMRVLLDHAFERYFETSGLFGAPATCLAMIERLRAIGVDEIACLVDFGVDPEQVLSHLEHLDRVRQEANRPAPAEERDPLADLVARHGVTHLQCTPSLARLLVAQESTRAALRSLRLLLVGGEALDPTLAAELRRRVPGRVLNMYGPTETTVWSSSHRVEAEDAGTVPIGRPLANTQFYVLDRWLRPVPEGAAGELFIGGEGVARGYLNRPELTAERFVSDPFSPAPGARLYRTGDRVRHRPDGCLEFLGRADDQVKLRGHRIELGEIEDTLRQFPGVRDAAAALRGGGSDARLVAYVVPGAPAAPAAEALREFLRARLPEPMLPSAVVTLADLPLTPNGKLDRKALPEPNAARGKAPSAEPQSALEQAVAAVWRDVLGLDRVSLDDNFFDLGGHSLLTVQVQTRLRPLAEREVSLTELFRFPTIRALTRHLGRGGEVGEAASAGRQRGEARRQALLGRRRVQPRA